VKIDVRNLPFFENKVFGKKGKLHVAPSTRPSILQVYINDNVNNFAI